MALLRRLEKRILVPLPEHEAREAMVRHHLPPGPEGSGKRAADDIDFNMVAEMLEGYSGSDIRLVCKEAAMKPLRRIMTKIDLVS
jgi:katanin p60 ATPase-containing subunit A1